jgi:hypothetical protein
MPKHASCFSPGTVPFSDCVFMHMHGDTPRYGYHESLDVEYALAHRSVTIMRRCALKHRTKSHAPHLFSAQNNMFDRYTACLRTTCGGPACMLCKLLLCVNAGFYAFCDAVYAELYAEIEALVTDISTNNEKLARKRTDCLFKLACYRNDTYLITLLYDRGCLIDMYSALHSACEHGNSNAIHFCRQVGLRLDIMTHAFVYLCMYKRDDMARLFVECGFTAFDRGLAIACQYGRTKVAELMLMLGAKNIAKAMAICRTQAAVIRAGNVLPFGCADPACFQDILSLLDQHCHIEHDACFVGMMC